MGRLRKSEHLVNLSSLLITVILFEAKSKTRRFCSVESPSITEMELWLRYNSVSFSHTCKQCTTICSMRRLLDQYRSQNTWHKTMTLPLYFKRRVSSMLPKSEPTPTLELSSAYQVFKCSTVSTEILRLWPHGSIWVTPKNYNKIVTQDFKCYFVELRTTLHSGFSCTKQIPPPEW